MPLRGADVPRHPVRRVEARAGHDLHPGSYPASIPAVSQLMEDGLDLGPGVTFLVGENGSGKSTIVEAIARAFGLSPEGGSTHSLGLVAALQRVVERGARCCARPAPRPRGYARRADPGSRTVGLASFSVLLASSSASRRSSRGAGGPVSNHAEARRTRGEPDPRRALLRVLRAPA